MMIPTIGVALILVTAARKKDGFVHRPFGGCWELLGDGELGMGWLGLGNLEEEMAVVIR